ncbi:MAG: carbon-nitrogen hydrolase family protein [Planctomycetaceae bacterium]
MPRIHLSFLAVLLLATAARCAEPRATLRVAAAQIPVTRDMDANVAAIHRSLDTAISEQADILLTPEGSLSGYTPKFDQTQVERRLEEIVARASAAGVALALGTCYVEPSDGQCYNQIRFYDETGAFLGFHAKILRCGSLTDPPKGEINDYATRPLGTFEIKGITVGGLICNDMWGNPQCTPMPDPHLSQQHAQAGVRIIFLAINGGRSGNEWSENVYWPYHETNMRMRAAAGKLWLVSADNCAPTDIPCSAPSGVLQPDGTWAAKAPPQGEHVVVYSIHLD